jgi:hypothetical protein
MARRTGRREFISALGGAVIAWPRKARAQQPNVPVIGYLDTASASTTAHLVAAFRQGLSTAGYDEGRNVGLGHNVVPPIYNGDRGRRSVGQGDARGGRSVGAG